MISQTSQQVLDCLQQPPFYVADFQSCPGYKDHIVYSMASVGLLTLIPSLKKAPHSHRQQELMK